MNRPSVKLQLSRLPDGLDPQWVWLQGQRPGHYIHLSGFLEQLTFHYLLEIPPGKLLQVR